MGRRLEIDWQATASELKECCRNERNSERKVRLHVLWQLRLGESLAEIAEMVGMGYRTVQNWVAWYRHGGLKEVLIRIKRHGNQGRPAQLSALQYKALAAKVALGSFRNV